MFSIDVLKVLFEFCVYSLLVSVLRYISFEPNKRTTLNLISNISYLLCLCETKLCTNYNLLFCIDFFSF